MTKVLTSGTFDILHYGHIRLLRRAKALGDYLIVACSNDECVKTKGKACYYPFEIRKELLESIKYVDEVVEETAKFDDALLALTEIVQANQIDVYVIGSDYRDTLKTLKGYDEFSRLVKIVYLERTEGISTTQIKKHLGK